MSFVIANPQGLAPEVVNQAHLELAKAMETWARPNKSPLSMFTREKFSHPVGRRQAIEAARDALSDDVVSTTLELMSSMALDTVAWESPDPDVTKVWNKASRTAGIDSFSRSLFEEISVIGCATVATWWGETKVRPSGTGPGGRARRPKPVVLPQRFVIIPAEKIYKVDNFWDVPKLLWLAENDEEYMSMQGSDPTLSRLVSGRATVNESTRMKIVACGGNPDYALELNPKTVWQCRLPGAIDYSNSDETPMTRILPWLEMKARLMDSDRASLIGAANFIIVVKIGSPEEKAQNEELAAFREGMKTIAKTPFFIGDHRYSVEILTPQTEQVLNKEKHGAINHRIAASILGLPDDDMLPNRSDLEVPARMMVARLKARRGTVAEAINLNLGEQGAERNSLDDAPTFTFTPREIPVIGVAAQFNSVLAARARRDLSRTTYLEALGYDASIELERVRVEQAPGGPDEVFQTHQPFDSPSGAPNTNGGQPTDAVPSDQNNPGTSGGSGGRPLGDKTKPGQANPNGAGQ